MNDERIWAIYFIWPPSGKSIGGCHRSLPYQNVTVRTLYKVSPFGYYESVTTLEPRCRRSNHDYLSKMQFHVDL